MWINNLCSVFSSCWRSRGRRTRLLCHWSNPTLDPDSLQTATVWRRPTTDSSPYRRRLMSAFILAGSALPVCPYDNSVSVSLQMLSSAGRISVPRLSVGAVSSRPGTPTLGESCDPRPVCVCVSVCVLTCVFLTGTPSVQSVGTKVGAPVSLTGQRFTVQIPPPSQTATTKTSKSLLLLPVWFCSLIGKDWRTWRSLYFQPKLN